MKGIEDLIAALESGDYAKSCGQFQVTQADFDAGQCDSVQVGYCCLGVYATINEMRFPREQGIFVWDNEEWNLRHGTARAQIPEDHWLAQLIHITESSFQAAGYDVQLQSYLTDLNDDSDTFEPVIRALKAFAGGQRAFPPAPTFISAVEE